VSSFTYLIPQSEFDKVRNGPLSRFERLALAADMCRLNALSAVKRAGSGHLGSSFSAMDIMVALYLDLLNVREVGINSPNRDVFLSSKGHDVPAQYAILHALGIVPPDRLLRLRRLNGLEGHPNVQVPGVEANTGSLGMGVAKGRGIAVAKRLAGLNGRVVVMTGDGELQEGQIYESLQATSHQHIALTVVVDHNKIQSDKPVSEISDLGDLGARFRAFGWHVERCNGHDIEKLVECFQRCFAVENQPSVIIADTIKGRGVSFMEGPRALREGRGIYRWHAGAPDDEAFRLAHEELLEGIEHRLRAANMQDLLLESIAAEPKTTAAVTDEFVAEAFGKRLVQLASERSDLIVLDGDLASDCRVRGFEVAYPERFVENGIAEQDMVSMAGALARHGFLPVVNSFASFLAARANEQIYNNLTEGSKVIYACHFGGVIPAGPGPSHQSVRDILLFGALPGVTVVEPCNAVEAIALLDWCVRDAVGTCAIRMAIGPSPRRLVLPQGYRCMPGRGTLLREGTDILVFGYGPVILHEILAAADALGESDVSIAVANMPWLNRVDSDWLAETVATFPVVVAVDNHSPVGGLGDSLLRAMASRNLLDGRQVVTFGVEEIPVCGKPSEVLAYHLLDAASLAQRLLTICGRRGLGPASTSQTLSANDDADAAFG